MPVANHEIVDVRVLNEIEALSIAKTHTKVIEELENDPKKFNNFKVNTFFHLLNSRKYSISGNKFCRI
jgi:hypothetical protein